jgi:hypothetical protein
VGTSSFDHHPNDPARRPDLQLLSDRALGDGDEAVCGDARRGDGVPAMAALSFEIAQPVSDAMNDLGCRFIDGRGRTRGRAADDACTLQRDGTYRFVGAESRIQFCATVSRALGLPDGDTRLRVRLRDAAGRVGASRDIVVRSQD